jgi:hypothetical protein
MESIEFYKQVTCGSSHWKVHLCKPDPVRPGMDRFCSIGYVETFQNTPIQEKINYINDIFNTDR